MSAARENADERGAWIEAFRQLWSDLICSPEPKPVGLPPGLACLAPGARAEIAGALWPDVCSEHHRFVLSHANDRDLAHLPMPQSEIRGVFAADFLAFQADGLRAGRLSFAGGNWECAGGLFIRNNGLTLAHAYRCTDRHRCWVAYVICTDWNYSVSAIYFPAEATIVFGTPDLARYAEAFLGEPAGSLLLQEAAAHVEALNVYLPSGNAELSAFCFYNHLGHHLWNELTGLDHLVAGGSQPASGRVFVVGAALSEIYGSLDRIFPDLRAKVDRSIASIHDLPGFCYRNRVGFLHPTGSKISTGLRQRLMALADAAPESVLVAPAAEALRRDGFPIVVPGLRVENRTLTDLPGFCVELVRLLAAVLGRVVVVIDGHNAAPNGPGAVFASLWMHGRDMLGAERRVLDSLQTEFSGNPDVRLVSTLGESMALSLFWAARAAFFVTPWGAGMAKYRWVCNRPGLFVSNAAFLRNPESRLYDDERYLDRPAPTWRIAPEEATDRPEAEALIAFSMETRRNFEVDMRAVERELRRMAADLLGVQG